MRTRAGGCDDGCGGGGGVHARGLAGVWGLGEVECVCGCDVCGWVFSLPLLDLLCALQWMLSCSSTL